MTVFTKLSYRNSEISNLNFFKKIEIFNNMGPYGSENFKMLLPQFWFFLDEVFPVTVHTKLACWNFEISNLNFLKKILKFNIVTNGKVQNCQSYYIIHGMRFCLSSISSEATSPGNTFSMQNVFYAKCFLRYVSVSGELC